MNSQTNEPNPGRARPIQNFLIGAALLMVLYASIMSRDISEPFFGLHSWGQAHLSWLARSHVVYGLDYTQGLFTWAVGMPPPESPDRYLDHPQLPALLNAISLSVFGVNDWAQRLGTLIVSVLTLPFLLSLLRRLYDARTALLAGTLYVLFPITGYFYWIGAWTLLVVIAAFWCYFTLIGGFKDQVQPRTGHLVGLAITLFLMVQLSWAGFMYAAAIGTHYVIYCLQCRSPPAPKLILILIASPFVSLALILGILIAARGWDYGQMIELYTWRSTLADTPLRTTSAWWSNFFSLMKTNFTLPALILVVAYFAYEAVHQVRSAFNRGTANTSTSQQAVNKTGRDSRSFAHAWVFFMPGALYTAVFTEAMWVHQFKYQYFSLFIAIAAALAILRLRDLVARGNSVAANIAAATVFLIVFASCAVGLNRYHDIEYYPPRKIELFRQLNGMLEPEQKLLSYESYVVQENPAKGAFYRPEIAWYLDREIVVAKSLAEIQEYAATGLYPYFLMANTGVPLFLELKARYKYTYIQGRPRSSTRVGMPSYHIFYLQ